MFGKKLGEKLAKQGSNDPNELAKMLIATKKPKAPYNNSNPNYNRAPFPSAQSNSQRPPQRGGWVPENRGYQNNPTGDNNRGRSYYRGATNSNRGNFIRFKGKQCKSKKQIGRKHTKHATKTSSHNTKHPIKFKKSTYREIINKYSSTKYDSVRFKSGGHRTKHSAQKSNRYNYRNTHTPNGTGHFSTNKQQTKPYQPQGGQIKFHLNQWKAISSDKFILEMAKGLDMDFIETPQQQRVPRQYRMPKEHKQILNQEIQNMLDNKSMIKVEPTQNQFISQIFLRKGETKNRPIINFRELNKFIPYQKFKMETLSDLKELIQKDDYMIKIDLKNAYLAVPLSERHSKYVRFQWQGNLYQCLTLFFGMAQAPRCFTKLMKVPISILRRIKIRLMIYIDDIIIMAQEMSHILMARDTTLYLLQSLGLTINFKKSVLNPSHIMEYLGILINSISMTMELPQEKFRS